MLSSLTKGLLRIANSLPRLDLAAVLYPTKRMKQAVAELYANIIQFFLRAQKWYQEGKIRHAIHSITRPVELRYNDLIEGIEECSSNLDKLAWAGSQAEQRDMHSEIKELRSGQVRSEELLFELKKLLICQYTD